MLDIVPYNSGPPETGAEGQRGAFPQDFSRNITKTFLQNFGRTKSKTCGDPK